MEKEIKMLNKTQLAAFLGLSKSSVEKYMYGGMPYYKRIGNTVVIHGKPMTVDEIVGNERVVFIEDEVIEWIKTK